MQPDSPVRAQKAASETAEWPVNLLLCEGSVWGESWRSIHLLNKSKSQSFYINLFMQTANAGNALTYPVLRHAWIDVLRQGERTMVSR